MVSRVSLLLLVSFWLPCSPAVAQVEAPECGQEEEKAIQTAPDGPYGEGLLWRLSRNGIPSSYIFGTIHVSDEDVIHLDGKVVEALAGAKHFAMEVVPDSAEIMGVAGRMYFDDGRRLDDYVSDPLFREISRLLASYHLDEQAAGLIKPWAAFLTLSYPPDFGQVQDLRLMEMARSNGAAVTGLETLQEQLDIFEQMSTDKQVRLLADMTCHYDLVALDFEQMKSLYRAEDLAGLYSYGQRYSRSDDGLYRELIRKLLTERNYTMVERMQPLLQNGRAFIAIGAMHLAGTEGVLSLLERLDYQVNLVH